MRISLDLSDAWFAVSSDCCDLLIKVMDKYYKIGEERAYRYLFTSGGHHATFKIQIPESLVYKVVY